MNGKTSKRIHKKTKSLLVEWVRSLLPEEKDKENIELQEELEEKDKELEEKDNVP